MGVEASVIVIFDGDDADHGIVVELDDVHPANLDAEGEAKSSFLPPDSPVFLINHPDTIEITRVASTDGSVSLLRSSPTSRTRTTDGLFTSLTSNVSMSYSNARLVETTWFGNEGIVHFDDISSTLEIDSGIIPCFGKFDFSVDFNYQYQLTPPSLALAEDETYTIYVVIYARKVSFRSIY